MQLPPSLSFDARIVAAFFSTLRRRYDGFLACEPRHPSWFAPKCDRLLTDREVARVAADPAVVPDAAEPGGWEGLVYFRLHGSPKIYYSDYSDADLSSVSARIAGSAVSALTWCIFDNTALGAATANALMVVERLRKSDETR